MLRRCNFWHNFAILLNHLASTDIFNRNFNYSLGKHEHISNISHSPCIISNYHSFITGQESVWYDPIFWGNIFNPPTRPDVSSLKLKLLFYIYISLYLGWLSVRYKGSLSKELLWEIIIRRIYHVKKNYPCSPAPNHNISMSYF